MTYPEQDGPAIPYVEVPLKDQSGEFILDYVIAQDMVALPPLAPEGVLSWSLTLPKKAEEVSMIGHYNRNAEIESFVMSKYAGIQNDIPRPSGKLVAILGNKSDEMRFVIALIMRQISPAKAHEGYCC